jgi:hypothetical protein
MSTVFYLLSVPFAVPRALLRVPSGGVVERTCPAGATELTPTPQLQSA